MRGRRGAGAGSGAGTHPSLTSPHPRVAACRLQEEMLQREEAESTLQSFRQVGAAAAGRWGRKVGAGLGWGLALPAQRALGAASCSPRCFL